MINAIKRTWVPKNVAAQAVPAAASTESATASVPNIYAGLCMFDDLPSPHAQEVDSVSVWSAFEDVQPMAASR